VKTIAAAVPLVLAFLIAGATILGAHWLTTHDKSPLSKAGVWLDMKSGRGVNAYRNGYQACLDSVRYIDRIRGAGDMTEPIPVGSYGPDTTCWVDYPTGGAWIHQRVSREEIAGMAPLDTLRIHGRVGIRVVLGGERP
jgi:hypothetical protein